MLGMVLNCSEPHEISQMLDAQPSPKQTNSIGARHQLTCITMMQVTVSKHVDVAIRPQVDSEANVETTPQPKKIVRRQLPG